MKTILSHLILLTATFNSLYAQHGVLDNSFNGDGLVQQQLGKDDKYPTSWGNTVLALTNGKILVGGIANNTVGSEKAMVAKFNSDGSLDTDFGISGIWYSPVQQSTCIGLHAQPDGKILVLGQATPVNERQFYLHRLNENGTSDNTFGNNGYVTAGLANEFVNAISTKVMKDGRVVFGGSYFNPINAFFARFNANGTLDNSFNGTGTLALDVGGNTSDFIEDIAIQKDGKILATGNVKISTYEYEAYVIRLNKDGSYDNTFGNNGKFLHQFSYVTFSDDSKGKAIAIQDDGKILIAGYVTETRKFLARLDTNGILDYSFGDSAVVKIELYDVAEVRKLLVQPDGKIIIGGNYPWNSTLGASDNFVLFRFNKDGTVDSTFGTDGIVSTDFGLNGDDECKAIAPQKDGKVLAVGQSEDTASLKLVGIARYTTGLTSWPLETVGKEKIQKAEAVIIYPNPVHSQFFVQLPPDFTGPVNIELFNMIGENVGSSSRLANVNGRIIFERDGLESGLYLLVIKNEEAIISAKVSFD